MAMEEQNQVTIREFKGQMSNKNSHNLQPGEAMVQVQDYIDTNATCGGWNLSQSVGGVPGEGISRVTGLPGRDGIPMKKRRAPLKSKRRPTPRR